MIKKRGSFSVHKEGADTRELIDSVDALREGDYEYLIYDKRKNRSLPQLKYLFGVVLKTISDSLADHPPVDALYRWFEQAYSPIHSCNIEGSVYEYTDLKNENSATVEAFIQKVIRHARDRWGIEITDQDALKTPECSQQYIEAYAEVWRNILDNQSTHST